MKGMSDQVQTSELIGSLSADYLSLESPAVPFRRARWEPFCTSPACSNSGKGRQVAESDLVDKHFCPTCGYAIVWTKVDLSTGQPEYIQRNGVRSSCRGKYKARK